MKNVFFFEKHPPLGKQLIATAAYLAGYDGNYTFSKIGSEYSTVIGMRTSTKRPTDEFFFQNVPVFWLRFMPALFGSWLVPVTYNLLLQLRINRWVAAMGGLLIVFGKFVRSNKLFRFTSVIRPFQTTLC